MKATRTILAAVGLLSLVAVADEPAGGKAKEGAGGKAADATAEAPKDAPKDAPKGGMKEKRSYCLGVNIGNGLKQDLQRQELDMDLDQLAKGLKDALVGGKLEMSEEEMADVLQNMQKEMMQKQKEMMQKRDESMAAAGAVNRKEGAAFLAKNKEEKGVVVLPSGLQYRIIKAGEGKKPLATDTVECHYKGTLINGTEFDSSYRRGTPATFRVGGVIPGWQEALQLMPAGSKWQLFIPSEMAYGPRGAGRDIGPDATLIFEVELLGIK